MRPHKGAYVRAPVYDEAELVTHKRRRVHSGRKAERHDRSKSRSLTVSAAMTLGLMAIRRYRDFQTAVDGFEPLSVHALNVRLERLESVWGDFEKAFIEQKGGKLSEEQIIAVSNCYGEAEEIYLSAKIEMRTRLENMQPAVTHGVTTALQQTVQVQLAEAACVPKFSGSELEWANFRDAYMTEIHANTRYTDAQKLRKLLSLLEGRAKNAMGTWTTSNADAYPAAIAALCKLYDNEYGTIRAHMQKVFALKQIQQASRDNLREILDTVRSAQRQLLLLLPPEKLGEYILLNQIEQNLDPDSQAQWGMRRTTDALPTLDQMFEFLELRASLLANVPRSSRWTDELRRPASLSASTQGNLFGRGNEPMPKCDLCTNQHHWPFRCLKFRAMTLSDRMAYISRRKMCTCCFSLKHLVATCTDRPCPRCNVRHNSCLCPQNQYTSKAASPKPEQSQTVATLNPRP